MMKRFPRPAVLATTLALISVAFWSVDSHAISLDEYLARVKKNHPLLEAVELSKKAAELRGAQADLELSPYLIGKLGYQDDQKINDVPFQGTRSIYKDFQLGVAKRFTTGTDLSLTFEDLHSKVENTPTPPSPYKSSLTFALSQSLWKNGFGRGIRLRHERESAATRLERLGQEAQARQILTNAELAYWTYAYEQQEQKIQRESLERAKRLISWAQRRTNTGLGDRSDLLQVQGLYGARELLLIGAEDEARAAATAAADFISASPAELGNEIPLEDKRALEQITGITGNDKAVRIDALVQMQEAKLKSNIAQETRENLRPELNLTGQVSTNGRETDLAPSVPESADPHHPTLAAGLNFRMDLDPQGQSKVLQAANADAKASQLKSERLQFESESAWRELLRRHEELDRRIKAARALVKVQNEKLARERDRLDRGRTVTSQVITFEQDAAESESLLLQLLVQQRKLEAQARMFIPASRAEDL